MLWRLHNTVTQSTVQTYVEIYPDTLQEADVLQKLRSILHANFEALGFSLLSFELVRGDIYDKIIRALVRCPCGGHEYLNYVLDRKELNPYTEARSILSTVCSYEHLSEDVAQGKLPPFDIGKHVFKTLIIPSELHNER